MEQYVIDQAKRTPKEWAEIYHIELFDDLNGNLWNEFEWAYNMINLNYRMLPNKNKMYDEISYEQAECMEMRAMYIKQDIINNADFGEKQILKEKYTETSWIRSQLL